MKHQKFLEFRRKREGKTNYKNRLELLKSNMIRIVVRKSLKNITIQAVQYHPDGDKTIMSVTSKELKEFGWKGSGKNTPAAYLLGYLFGIKAKSKKIAGAILDKGLYPTRKGTFVFAVLKGITEAGFNVPHDAVIFPEEDRVKGEHISDEMVKQFEQTKNNIQKVK